MGIAELRTLTGSDPTEDGVGTIAYPKWGRLVWRRFRRRRLAVIGAGIVALVALLAFLGPAISPSPAPLAEGQLTLTQSLEAMHHDASPQIVPPSWRYLFGTDQHANPVLYTVLSGGQAPLLIGFLGALLATLIGIVSGAIAGYAGGWTDTLWMRVVDTFLAMPFIPLLLLATTSLNVGGVGLGVGISGYVILFGLLGWPGVARLIRGYVLSMRDWEMIDAARAVGLSEPAIVFRHILPNVLGVMVVSFTLNVAVFIGAEVTLEFLGAPQPASVTWGYAMSNGVDVLLAGEWWVVLFPAAAVLLAVLGVSLLGDGLRDAIDAVGPAPAPVEASALSRRLRSLPAPLPAGISRVRGLLARASCAAAAWLRLRMAPFTPAGRARPAATTGRRLRTSDLRLSLPLALLPPLAVLLMSGAVILAGSAPRTSAPHWTAPVSFVSIEEQRGYAAQALPNGGWALLAVDTRGSLLFRRLDGRGRATLSALVTRSGAQISDLAIAWNGRRRLGAWLAAQDGETVLQAAYLGVHPSPFTVASGPITHPSILALPGGGFGILFDRARGQSNDLYLAQLPRDVSRSLKPAGRSLKPAGRPAWVRRILRPPEDAIVPRGVVDGNRHLDLIYLDLCCNRSIWHLEFQRFMLSGRAVSRPLPMAEITTLTPFGKPARVPVAWGLDIARDDRGGVWAAGYGDYGIYAGHWSSHGAILLYPQRMVCVGDSCPPISYDAADLATVPLSLVLTPGHRFVFYSVGSLEGVHPYGATFSDYGEYSSTERIAYDYGGGASDVRAGSIGQAVAALWVKHLYSGQTVLEGTTYRARPPFDPAARLGLNVGPVWANVAVLVLGSLLGAVPLTAINVFLLALFLALWAVVSRLLAGWIRWPVYLASMAAVLVWAFAISSTAPGFVLVLPAWGNLYGWFAVGGAVFVSGWAGYFLLRHQDAWFRALAMAILAVYFLAVLSALVGIQGELAQI